VWSAFNPFAVRANQGHNFPRLYSSAQNIRSYFVALNEIMQRYSALQRGRLAEQHVQLARMKAAEVGPKRKEILKEVYSAQSIENLELIDMTTALGGCARRQFSQPPTSAFFTHSMKWSPPIRISRLLAVRLTSRLYQRRIKGRSMQSTCGGAPQTS